MSIQAPASESSSKTPARALRWGVAALLAGLAAGYGLSKLGSAPSEELGAHTARILAEQDTLRRGRDLATLFTTASPEGLDAIRDAYAAAPARVDHFELVLLAEWWARFAPVAADEWVQQLSGGKRFTARQAVFRAWARNSGPADALGAAQGISDPDERRFATNAVLIGWDESLETGLAEYVYELPQGPERQYAMTVLARRRVATAGGKDAMAWARELPETKQFRELMVPRVFGVIAESEPETAARMVEDLVDESSRSGIPRRIATRWVRRDPEAAMAWLETLPPGVDRDDGVMEAFRDWSVLERKAANAWMEARLLEPARWLEPAMFIYARATSRRDPRRAVEIADLITDETQRNTVHTLILRRWLVRDPEAAEAWVREANLPPGVVQRGRMTRGVRRAPAPSPEPDPSPASGPESTPGQELER